MLKLSDVTLVLIETREHELGRLALEDCLRQAEFGEVLVFTDQPSYFKAIGPEVKVVTVPDWPDKKGWSRCFWYEVPLHLHTSHALGIQWDSWIVAPEMWRDEYLKYDYVGAPWWYKNGMNVGNGGFSLRSTKFLRFVRAHRDKFPCITDLDDDLYCRKYRPALQDSGFVWAPEPLALNFAFECVRPDASARHFGFHAAYNFDYGCEGNEDRILERGQIMARSNYMTKTNPYIWEGFVKKVPWIVERLDGRANS